MGLVYTRSDLPFFTSVDYLGGADAGSGRSPNRALAYSTDASGAAGASGQGCARLARGGSG